MDKISEVSYLFFRNLKNLSSWVLDAPDLLVITGDNQQGKTNLLEAIYTALTGESFRTKSLGEIISHGKDQAMSEVGLQSGDRLRFVVTKTENEKVKVELLFNGEKILKKNNPYRYKAVYFLRYEADKIMNPSVFTKIVSRMLLRVRPDYREKYTRYMAWLKKRNEMLRTGNFNIRLLRVIDEGKLTPLCKEIRQMRKEYLVKLTDWINQRLKIDMHGLYVKIEEKNILRNVPVELEIERRTTLWGVHRDKLFLKLYPLDKKVPTQGVQVYLLFLTKLGILVQQPITSRYYFFLDDIGWELDKFNFAKLLRHMVSIGQVFFASPWWHQDVEQFLGKGIRVSKVVISNGKLL